MYCDVYAISGNCPQEGATHFPGYIYIYIYTCAQGGISISIVLVSVGLASLIQLYNLKTHCILVYETVGERATIRSVQSRIAIYIVRMLFLPFDP